MKIKISLFVLLACFLCCTAFAGSVYVIDYDSYEWSPCHNGLCYAINCGLLGCQADGKHILCKDESCVTKILDEYGEEHLLGIWKIDYVNRTSEKMKYQRKYRIESELQREWSTSPTINTIDTRLPYTLDLSTLR